jgi:Mitochondrial DNA-directed RNA polymerase
MQVEKQRELEDNALSMGLQRFRRRLEQAEKSGQGSTIGAARRLLVEAIEPATKAIEYWIETTKKKRGPKPSPLKWVEAVGAEVAAYMTTRVIINAIHEGVTVRRIEDEICELIEDELRYRRFQEEAPGLFSYTMAKFDSGHYAHNARSLDSAMNYARIDTSDLLIRGNDKVRLGQLLRELWMQATDLVDVERSVSDDRVRGSSRKSSLRNTQIRLIAKPETLRWITARNQALELLWPVNLPMLMPPMPWGPGRRGGYRFAMRGKHAFVRASGQGERISHREMPKVYDAVNRMQETPWKINGAVLDLLFAISQRGGNIAGIPKTEPIERPARLSKTWESGEARKADPDFIDWKMRVRRNHVANYYRRIACKQFNDVVSLAKMFRDAPAFWYPYNVDFRGRVYPIATGLTPQGDDLQKSLLMFAEGKPLTDDGINWLAIHVANCLEVDPAEPGRKLTKATLDARAEWTVTNTYRIQQVARRPFDNLWWTEADSPLQFYAACVEWANLMDAVERGEDYVCALPVSIDGTCNGLQHFSAMLRDERLASAVNVVATSTPGDIYAEIAEEVEDILGVEAAGGDELARKWLDSGLLGRSLCKRPTMTVGYGSKRYGFVKQTKEYLRGLGIEKFRGIKEHFTMERDGKPKVMVHGAATVLADAIWSALGTRASGAFTAMGWLQRVAAGIVRNGKCAEWVVPATGFLVVQEYFETNKKQIQTVLAGKLYQPVVREATTTPDRTRQCNAIAPNVVHSLDAAALMLAVEMASVDGVECFAMVHDSYGTLPNDVPVLRDAARRAFYTLYSQHDVLADLAEQLKTQHDNPEKFPALPAKGELDLSEVLVSEYFFS